MSDAADATVVARREGAAGTLLMNRPRALNALDMGMIRGIRAALDAWRDDAAVKLALLEGAGKAFCAGGDIRGLRDAAAAGDAATCRRSARNPATAPPGRPASDPAGTGTTVHSATRPPVW